MVRVLRRRAGGAGGKLTGDPAIRTAAVALINGWADPLDVLALDPDDYAVAVAVVAEADRLRADQAKALADYTAAKTANLLLPGLVKALSRLVKRLFSGRR